ncbi:hypothetical protein GC098_14150 [Paenibacillus sp. LMG 31458]|uniref:Uncharacterized protein n=1 Tax=Paenibacillus phytorum TaxID=2654977 RepID=A0ABX1XVH6_9BACL|nr:hypothetical protein [Paenibacillus phytorum]NOU72555.1 hypothetical protein [Paenibacillus phytorum]
MKNTSNQAGGWVLDHTKEKIEIQFPHRPENQVLDRLRKSDFQFSWPMGIWWAKDTPKNRDLANEVAVHEGVIGFKGTYAQRLRGIV